MTEQLMSERRSADRVHVALCADHGFVVPLAVALASLAASSEIRNLTVHVINSGFDEALRERLLVGAAGLQVEWYEIDRGSFTHVHNSDFLTVGALYRLMLGEILAPQITRVLYLDADTLITGDIEGLFYLPLEGRPIGAVRDCVAPWAAGVYGADWRLLGVDPGSKYFNSGVLLIDLEKWRAVDAGAACIDVLRRVDARWGDQDALNKVFEGDWTELPRRWNVQTADLQRDSFSWALAHAEIESAVIDPGVLHFTSRDKPWAPGSSHPASERWFKMLDETAWAGWRPARPVDEHRGAMAFAAALVRSARQKRADKRGRLPE